MCIRDRNTVVVSNTGRIIAVAPGSAEISASAGDGKYTDSIAVTVTGERFTMPTSGTLELDQTILNYTSISTTTMQIPSEKLHGIYFLQGSSLFFYSLVTLSLIHIFHSYSLSCFLHIGLWQHRTKPSGGLYAAFLSNTPLFPGRLL